MDGSSQHSRSGLRSSLQARLLCDLRSQEVAHGGEEARSASEQAGVTKLLQNCINFQFLFLRLLLPDLLSRRFREGISFPKSLERCILKCPSPSCAPCPSLYRTEHFSRGRGAENVPKRGKEEGWPAKSQKGKKDAQEQVSYKGLKGFLNVSF